MSGFWLSPVRQGNGLSVTTQEIKGCFMIRVHDQSHLRWKTMCFRYVWYKCFCIVGKWSSMFPKFCGIKYLWTIFMTGQRQPFSERTYIWRNTTLDATVWGKYEMLWFLSTIMFLYCRQLKVSTPQIRRHHVLRFTFYNMSNFMFSERTYFDGTTTSKIWLCDTEKLKRQLQSFYPKCLELGWEFINKIYH